MGEDLTLRDFTGTANFSRLPQGLYLQADFQGKLDLECVHCLSFSEHNLKIKFTELYAFDDRSVSDSGLLVPDNGNINLKPVLRDYAMLEIPISPKCKPECKGLCPRCGQNLNEKDCGHNREIDTSPFAPLKPLFKDQSQ